MITRFVSTAAALGAGVCLLVGCSRAAPEAEADAPPAETPAAAAEGAATPAAASAVQPVAPDAPDFAVVYPGGEPQGPPTLAMGPAGPGGILVFTTADTPDKVIEFYRGHAETHGLASIINMTQDGAKAYSAGDGAQGRGQLLSVVATPIEGGGTSVQLDWSAGR